MITWSRLVYEENTLGIPGLHSIGQYNYVAAKPGLPPHRHIGCVEISLLVKGHQAYRVDGQTYHVNGGEQYVSMPGEMHDSGSEPQDKGVLYWVILDITKEPDKFLNLAPAMAQKLIAAMLEMPARHFVAVPGIHSTLDRAIKTLQQIRTPDECFGIFEKGDGELVTPRSTDESFHLLEASSHIVYYILQTIAASRANVRSISPVIRASLDFMAANEEAWLSVSQVAEHIHLSESYFKILFREEVGLPPAEYMLRRKVEIAKAHLARPGCNITELAHRLGFSSSQYFATVFRRFTYQTPSEFMNGDEPEMTEIMDPASVG